MKLITRQDLANAAPAMWAEIYSRPQFSAQPDKQDKTAKLLALTPPINPDTVDAIIGSTSWTRATCNECGASPDELVEVGQSPDYDSSTARICAPCLKVALSLIAKE